MYQVKTSYGRVNKIKNMIFTGRSLNLSAEACGVNVRRLTHRCLYEVQEGRMQTWERRLFSPSDPSGTRFHRNTSWSHQTAACWQGPAVCRQEEERKWHQSNVRVLILKHTTEVTLVLPPKRKVSLTTSPLVHVMLLSLSFSWICVTLVAIAIVIRRWITPGAGVLRVSTCKQQ